MTETTTERIVSKEGGGTTPAVSWRPRALDDDSSGRGAARLAAYCTLLGLALLALLVAMLWNILNPPYYLLLLAACLPATAIAVFVGWLSWRLFTNN
jgi:hypothetical protein